MTYHTHLFLGAELFPVICETWNVSLSRKRFLSGSVKPDVSSLFLRHPHFWRSSRRFVLKKIAKLSRKTLKPDTKNKRFSEDLGIVLHYIADFFTSAHNVRPNRIGEHLAFEAKLHAEFVNLIDSRAIDASFRMIRGTGGSRIARIEPLLKELHERFEPSLADPVADIREILVACLTVALFVMDAATEATGAGTESGFAKKFATR